MTPLFRVAARVACALLTLFFVSCEPDAVRPTEVVLVIDSLDLIEGSDITRLQVEVFPEFNDTVARQTAFADLGPGLPNFPRVLGLTYGGGRDGRYVVEVSGFQGAQERYFRRAFFSFVQGSSKRLRLILYRDCADNACFPEQNCGSGGTCDANLEPPLVDWTGSNASTLRLGPPSDVVPLDAGP